MWLEFFLRPDNKTSRDVIHKYSININNLIIHLNHMYSYYSYFIYSFELKIVFQNSLIVATTFINSIFCLDQFDSYEYHTQLYTFDKKGWKNIIEKK